MQLPFNITTPETHGLTCTRCTTISAPDSDSADNTYDPTRECFNIDGAIASDLEDEAAIGGRNTPPQVELSAERSKSASCRTGSMRNEKICAYFNKPSSMSAWPTHTAKELGRELVTSIVASSRIG
jgi:hypothetical protein